MDSGSPVNANEPSASVTVWNSPVCPTAVKATDAFGLASSRLWGETPGYGSTPINPKICAGGCPALHCADLADKAAATIAGRVWLQALVQSSESTDSRETKYSTPSRNGYPQAVDCELVWTVRIRFATQFAEYFGDRKVDGHRTAAGHHGQQLLYRQKQCPRWTSLLDTRTHVNQLSKCKPMR